jgi:MraZ protein
LLLGLVAGMAAGAGGVIWQLKYGSGPVIEFDAAAQAQSIVEEPKPVDQPTSDWVDEPVGAGEPGETTDEPPMAVVAPTSTDPAPPRGSGGSVEQVPVEPTAVCENALVGAAVETPAAEPFPFLGCYSCTMGDEGELVLPPEVVPMMADLLKQRLYVYFENVPESRSRCLLLFSEGDVRQFVQQFLYRDILERRQEASKFRPVQISPDGRLQLPAELAVKVGLKQNVVVLGVIDHFEIWDADTWQEYSGDVPASVAPSAVEAAAGAVSGCEPPLISNVEEEFIQTGVVDSFGLFGGPQESSEPEEGPVSVRDLAKVFKTFVKHVVVDFMPSIDWPVKYLPWSVGSQRDDTSNVEEPKEAPVEVEPVPDELVPADDPNPSDDGEPQDDPEQATWQRIHGGIP